MRYLGLVMFVFLLSFSLFGPSCGKTVEGTGNLVPPTAAEDARLPKLYVRVAGHSRAIHLETFGDSSRTVVFILPGGPGADFRLLLPLRALADSFYVIFWDPRGAGLSERVREEELYPDSFIEEIEEVKSQLSPHRQVILIGHSHGGLLLTRYAALHPLNVSKLLLIEPGQMKPSQNTGYKGGAVSFLDGQEFFWMNEILTSSDNAAADYKAIELLPKASRNFTCDQSVADPYPMWRFGTFHYYVLQKKERELPGSFSWSYNIENFKGPIRVIAGTCGAASFEFQQNYVLPYLPGASIDTVEGAGHISLFTVYSEQLLKKVREALR